MRFHLLAVAAVGLWGCSEWEPDPGPTTVVFANYPAPPRAIEISGGTLAIAGGGRFAAASDADWDVVWITDISNGTLHGKVSLPAGSHPGRIVEDGDGHLRVALRGTGH